ncbi:MAG: hypothetical protein M3O62_13675 [Pseudomonadota bacterium]|nr:hypothetical protein [Pseudomonadota bacterium]
MKVCVLSNSHAAALRQGLDRLDRHARTALDVTFFASRSDGLKALAIDGQKLHCTDPEVLRDIQHTSGGSGEIDLAHYDVFIVHAMGFRYPYTSLAAPYSQQFVTAWMRARWQQTHSYRLTEMLRAAPRAAIVVSPQPYLSEGDDIARALVEQAILPAPTLEQAFTMDAWPADGRVLFLPQPATTVVRQVLTDQRYSRGSVRLEVGDRQSGKAHPSTDHQHMNAEYGLLVWRDLMVMLAEVR